MIKTADFTDSAEFLLSAKPYKKAGIQRIKAPAKIYFWQDFLL